MTTVPHAEQPLTRHQLEAKIAKRCLADEAFRAEFIADPAACFTKFLGIPAANLPKIIVHDAAPGTWHIAVPPTPEPMRELSAEELEQVAGGVSTVSISLVATTAGLFATSVAAGAVASFGVGASIGIAAGSNKW